MKIHLTVWSLSCSPGYGPYLSIVTLTFDLWRWKSIGFILSLWAVCVWSLMKIHSTVWSLSCSQGHVHICPLWPWPRKSIGFILSPWAICVWSLMKIHSRVWSVSCSYGQSVTHMDGTTEALLYPPAGHGDPPAGHGDNNDFTGTKMVVWQWYRGQPADTECQVSHAHWPR